MVFDDISEAVLYEAWLRDNENISETEDIKSAFHAGFHLSFKRMTYLMRLAGSMSNASDSDNSKKN